AERETARDARSIAARRVAENVWPADGHLYAVLDGARSIRITTMLRTARDENASLYEGLEGEILAPFGPHLVRFEDDGELLAKVLADGWGESWCVFLHSKAA